MINIEGQPIFPGTGHAPSLYSIGWGLARTARFAGQTRTWYPVLPHVYSVAEIVSEEATVHAYLHDAAESVVGDQVATWKNELTIASEEELLDNIYRSLNLERAHPGINAEVHNADIACRSAEAFLLGHNCPDAEYFVAIRQEMPELYERALDETRNRIAIYTPDFCIGETDKRARYYESSVNRELRKVIA